MQYIFFYTVFFFSIYINVIFLGIKFVIARDLTNLIFIYHLFYGILFTATEVNITLKLSKG